MRIRTLAPPPVPRLAERLAVARRSRFVGRCAELELFRCALAAAELPFAVLHVHGPGGVGKTTLLQQFAVLAAEAGWPCFRLEGRELDAQPEVFLAAASHLIGVAAPGMGGWPHRAVLLIDTYEHISGLDAWLRERFLPELPSSVLVVIAGRQVPSVAWTADLAWAPLTRVLALRNLAPAEARSLLEQRGVPGPRQPQLLESTHGHPLALSLAADALAAREEGAPFDLLADRDVVRRLLEMLVESAPSALHRQALHACASVTELTEPLLAAALDLPDAGELFDWLGRQSFVEHGPRGLFPHDLAREVLYADSRWRNPDQRRALNGRLLGYLYARFQQASGFEQQRAWFDIIYVQRYNPSLRPYFVWSAVPTACVEPMAPADAPGVIEIAERHEGSGAARVAAHWIRRQPGAFLVLRGLGGELVGFMAHVRIDGATPEDLDADPAVGAALRHVERHGPARAGEEIAYLRFWMARDTYQQPSPAGNLLGANAAVYWMTHPRMAWNFVATRDADYMLPAMESLHIWRAPEADFELGGRRFGAFAHDWRVEPIAAWFATKVDRASQYDAQAQPPRPPPLLVLSREDFTGAVRAALRDYASPRRLASNLLLRTRLGLRDDGAPGTPEHLQALLRSASEALSATPRGRKQQQALWHTYLQPAHTQERAAELLGLPFSTFRYQLGKATERVVEHLWQMETGRPQ